MPRDSGGRDGSLGALRALHAKLEGDEKAALVTLTTALEASRIADAHCVAANAHLTRCSAALAAAQVDAKRRMQTSSTAAALADAAAYLRSQRAASLAAQASQQDAERALATRTFAVESAGKALALVRGQREAVARRIREWEAAAARKAESAAEDEAGDRAAMAHHLARRGSPTTGR